MLVHETAPEDWETTMQTVAERLEAKGWVRGKAEGKAEGMAEGMAS